MIASAAVFLMELITAANARVRSPSDVRGISPSSPAWPSARRRGRIGTLSAISSHLNHVVFLQFSRDTCAIEQFEQAVGKTFHLVSGNPVPIAVLTALDYPGFHVPRLVSAERFDPAHLSPTERALYENVTSAYATYLRRNPSLPRRTLLRFQGASACRRLMDSCGGSWSTPQQPVILLQNQPNDGIATPI
jgi:hypothetical protein